MMRTAVSPLSLLRPRTLREALTMLRDEAPLSPLAGCTDVYVSLQFGTLAEKRFVDLWPLPELRGIADDRGTLRIGALTTYTDLIQSPLVRRRVPMLVAASREIGGRQIQNRGTLGGNIANASPAGDALPVLAVADATIVLSSAEGVRRVSFNTFYTGYRTSVRRPDEIIVAIEVPRIEGRQVLAKGRHSTGAGDFKGHVRRRARPRGARGVGKRRAHGPSASPHGAGTNGRELPQTSASGDARRDRADRRLAIDGGLSTRSQCQLAR